MKKYIVRFEYKNNYEDGTDFHRFQLVELNNPFKNIYELEKHLKMDCNDEISNIVYKEKYPFEYFHSIKEHKEKYINN